MFRTAGSSNFSAPTFLSAMTLAAMAQDSSSTLIEPRPDPDPTWDILYMADEATTLWTYDETIVVGNSDTADMPRDMTGLSGDLTGTWEYIELDNTSELIEYLQFKIAWSVHILVISLRYVDSLTIINLYLENPQISFLNRPFSSAEMIALSEENLLSSLSWMIPLQGTMVPNIRLGLDSHIFLYNSSHDGIIHVTEMYDVKGESKNVLTYFSDIIAAINNYRRSSSNSYCGEMD